jgi:hypothetical protein
MPSSIAAVEDIIRMCFQHLRLHRMLLTEKPSMLLVMLQSLELDVYQPEGDTLSQRPLLILSSRRIFCVWQQNRTRRGCALQ